MLKLNELKDKLIINKLLQIDYSDDDHDIQPTVAGPRDPIRRAPKVDLLKR